MDENSTHCILFGKIEIPTSHVSPYAVDESVLLYEPPPEDIKKDENRIIFNNVPVTPEEENILEDFIKYIVKEYLPKSSSDQNENLEWLSMMQPEFLRFLHSTKFDFKKTIDWIYMNYQFRKSNMLPATLDDIEEELNSGCLYWFGRDLKCRPTMIADVFKLQDLPMEKLVKLVVFCFEFFLRYLHVGGKSENYNVLIDCDNKGVVNLPVQMIIQLTEIMNSKYRGRLNCLFLVNSPNMINMILKPLKGVMPDRLLKKIVVVREESKQDLLSLYNPNHLQKKFGGLHPDLTSDYYPFKFFPKGPLRCNSINLNGRSNGESELLVRDHNILKIPPFVLYGTCMIVSSDISNYLNSINSVNNHNASNNVNNCDKSKEANCDGLKSTSCNKVNWLKNLKYYILSRDTGRYLVDKLPELKEVIELNVIQDHGDLTRFINKMS